MTDELTFPETYESRHKFLSRLGFDCTSITDKEIRLGPLVFDFTGVKMHVPTIIKAVSEQAYAQAQGKTTYETDKIRKISDNRGY